MFFLSSAMTSRYPPTNNQLKTSSNLRTQATIQNSQVTIQNVQGRQSQGYAVNARKSQATGTRVINTVGEENANQPRVIRCYNCRGEGHMAKQCTTKKRVKDSKWFKEKMLLAQAQEAGVVLHEDQQDFINDRLEEMEDCDDLQLQTTSNFKVDHIDAYDSDCDEEATASAIFMASLSPIGSLNDDTVTPTYDSYILFKVPTYDNYHENDMLNSVIQETEYIEHFVSNNDSYDELTSDINVISYADYMVTIKNDVAQYVPPPTQDNVMILFVTEQIKSQVEKCNTIHQCDLDDAMEIQNKMLETWENGESGGLIEGRFGKRYGGNGGRGGSMSGVGEGKVDSMGEIGGGSLAICSMVSNDGRGSGRLVVEGGIGAEGGEVNGGGVDLRVSKRLPLEVAGEIIDESGGIEVGEVGGCANTQSVGGERD
ncbi:retrovirus-related pol polyprotein from transposon TNT 1-94 [Tanacetum coccineum]